MTSSMTRRAHLAALMAGAALGVGLRPALAQTVPWSSGTDRPTFTVPPGATDCHHHIYDARFPAAPGATLRPPDASVADYRLLMQRLGIARHVVVQPSTYGVDNSLLVQSLTAFGPTARGIAMLDASVTPDELKRLDGAGIRGVRFGTRLPGGAPITDMVPVARKIADFGWHIQLVSDGDKIVELADTLKGLPVPVVFDHMGHLPEPAGPDHPGFEVIVDLIDQHGAWVKLTGAYILSKVGPPGYADRSRLARAYVQRAPERLVWGSDWPHPTSPADAKPDDAVLLDRLADWAPDATLRNRILVANPAQLYGF
jgi:predicted TIM-barrel fold metal-dependent hydrolase